MTQAATIRRSSAETVARDGEISTDRAPPAGAGASPGHEKPAAVPLRGPPRKGPAGGANHYNDVKLWRDRAEECRAKSEGMFSPDARAALAHMAASYDGMANRAELRRAHEA